MRHSVMSRYWDMKSISNSSVVTKKEKHEDRKIKSHMAINTKFDNLRVLKYSFLNIKRKIGIITSMIREQV